MSRLWTHGRFALLATLGSVALLLAWGMASADPDFPISDYFTPIAIGQIVVFVATGFVRAPVLRNLLVLCLIIVPVVVLLGAETYMKHRDLEVIRNVEITDDVLLRYRYVPGAPVRAKTPEGRTYNALGYNDRDYAAAKPDDVYRIAILGDSVPNDGAIPNAEQFHERLEAALNEMPLVDRSTGEPVRRVEILNVSCEGYGTVQEVRSFETYGLGFDPDLVIVAYVLNDPFLQNAVYRRVGNSFFVFQLYTSLGYTLFDVYPDLLSSLFERLHSGYNYALAIENPLSRLGLLAKLRGFRVALAVVPLMLDFDEHPFEPLYEQVARTASTLGFDPIEFFDRFRQAGLERVSKGADFTHPNSEGHGLMAGALADYVLTRHLEKKSPPP